jgi:Mrp family chromosome partitioning ATPase
VSFGAATAERSRRDLAAAVRAIESAQAQSAGVPLDAVERLARDLGGAGEDARRIAVIGAVRNVGTTMTAIALARSLSQQARVVMVDLALGAPHLAIIASDPAAPGIAELVRGSATFGQIITRDRYSRVHLVMAGQEAIDAAEIMAAQRLSITIEALARSYDHVVIDAGTAADALLERLAVLAPRAVLVAPDLDNPETVAAREELLKAGFANVSVLLGIPGGPGLEATDTQAAA